MSATSTAGRGNGRASAGHLPQEVERACHLAERADGDPCVERRRVEFLVSEQPRAICVPSMSLKDKALLGGIKIDESAHLARELATSGVC